jgi:16S rRNA (guanine1516-N2)-methyltransferase
LIITTSQKENEQLLRKAQRFSELLGVSFQSRNGRSLSNLYEEAGHDEVLVVSKNDVKWHVKGISQSFFFHPGLSVVRIKRLLRGDNDIMIDTCQLKPGDSFLDCTLGLASDAIVASYAVGTKGRVVGIESEQVPAVLVREGLQVVDQFPEIDSAAKRVEVLQGNHLDILSSLPDRSFDVVYFDPMFREGFVHSSSLQVVRNYANRSSLSFEAVIQAKRVAKRMVILKEQTISGEFARLGFAIRKRENIDVSYGVITIREDRPCERNCL